MAYISNCAEDEGVEPPWAEPGSFQDCCNTNYANPPLATFKEYKCKRFFLICKEKNVFFLYLSKFLQIYHIVIILLPPQYPLFTAIYTILQSHLTNIAFQYFVIIYSFREISF